MVLCFAAQTLQAKEICKGLEVTMVMPNFYVYTTYHDYNGTSVSANSMYVVTDKGIVMIDVPWDTTKTAPLLQYMEQQYHKKVVLCISTHYHFDRTGALDILKRHGIKTYSTEQTLELCKKYNEKLPQYTFSKDTTFDFGDYSFETYYPGAGHTRDNIVIWFGKQHILYGGCFVKSVKAKDLGNLEDADVTAWPQSMRKVMQRYPHPRYLIAGHDDWRSTKSLQHTLDLLKKTK